jgi:hypothetical protein
VHGASFGTGGHAKPFADGVGGAPGGEKDEACASAGLAKVADQLK